MRKNILNLTVKKQWYDMIAEGTKKEEYREIKYYWIARLLKGGHKDVSWLKKNGEQESENLPWIPYTHVCFRNGYNGKKPPIEKRIVSISIGKPKRGLCPDEFLNNKFFIIKLK